MFPYLTPIAGSKITLVKSIKCFETYPVLNNSPWLFFFLFHDCLVSFPSFISKLLKRAVSTLTNYGLASTETVPAEKMVFEVDDYKIDSLYQQMCFLGKHAETVLKRNSTFI